MKSLTIAIPTYNRPVFLRTTLEALRPQACESAELLIVDDNSSPPVEGLAREILADSNWTYRIVRNAANVGLCANLLRCFEMATTEWMWLLSDDDVVRPDAVAKILKTVEIHPDLLFAVHSVQALPVKHEVIYDSVDSFFQELNSIPQVIFTSALFFNRHALIRHLRGAYNFLDTGAPQAALLLLAGLAGSRRKLAYFPWEIADWKPPTAEERYSQFALMGLHKLQGLCLGPARRRFAQLMVRDFPPPSRFFIHAVRDATNGRSRERLAMMLDEYFDAYGKMRGGFAGAFWRGPGRLVAQVGLRFANFSKALLDFTCRLLRGRPIQYEPNPVSINSILRLSETAGDKSNDNLD